MNIYIDPSADGRVEYVVAHLEENRVTTIEDLYSLARCIWPGVGLGRIWLSPGRFSPGVTLTNIDIKSENEVVKARIAEERGEAKRRLALTEEGRYVEDMLDKEIKILELPSNIQRLLIADGIWYIGDLITRLSPCAWHSRPPGIGEKSHEKIVKVLSRHRMQLRMKLPSEWKRPE